ncbi:MULTISPECIES: hypothetical protein [Amniculibacterium]|uniref:hypothetical protein n=1 Tax=Amniculibacterium TaxID=2715289 RepID=UPI000F598753|nr:MULTISPECIES: hypothetical protein [Amniculibacterium]
MIKVAYKIRRIIWNFIYGGLLVIIKVYDFLYEESIRWTGFFLLAVGILCIANAFYEYFTKYFEYNENEISTLGFFKKKIKFSDLIEIKYFGGEYFFKTLDATIVIEKSRIPESQLLDFKKVYGQVENQFVNRPKTV